MAANRPMRGSKYRAKIIPHLALMIRVSPIQVSLSTTNAAAASAGTQGLAGPTQTAVVTQRAGTPTTIPPNNFGNAEALCNPGEVADRWRI